MRLALFFSSLVAAPVVVSGFVVSSRSVSTSCAQQRTQQLLPLQMSSTEEEAPAATAEDSVPIVINGKNIDLTPAIVDYVNKRIGGNLNKLTSNGAIRECDVHLSVSKNPKVRENKKGKKREN